MLKDDLDALVDLYNHPSFIEDDPISVPHRFSIPQDIEIIGFWTAILAWGQRVTIINKANLLVELMDNAPYDFILNHEEADLKPFAAFKHRTFNGDDAIYFIHVLRKIYSKYESLESAFTAHRKTDEFQMQEMLFGFHHAFFDDEFALKRTRKHIASPDKNSTCKRLNMFMRWMVRKDDKGVDFGIWNDIPMSALMIPLDVHVEREARALGLLKRKQRDWKSVVELTEHLRSLDPSDPVKYDFALFGKGIHRKDGLE